MKVRIVALGKLKELSLRTLCGEYEKRLGAYMDLEVVALKDERAPEKLSDLERTRVLEREGARILEKIRPQDTVIVLAIEGRQYDSVAFSETFYDMMDICRGDMVFVIGSSMGLSRAVKERGDLLLSFSKMTMPHTLMRAVLLEQIYRASRIRSGHVYHK